MEAQQLHLTLKAKTRKRWTKADKRELRRLLGEGKKTKEIAQIMGITPQRVCTAKTYHVKRVRKANPVKRAKTADLTQELIRRGNNVTLGDKLAWGALAVIVLTVIISFIRM